MTLGEAQTKALQILNTYSIEGVANPDTYNNQADMKIRLTAFANDAQQEISRTNGRIVKEFNVITYMRDMAFSTPIDTVTMKHGETVTFTASSGNSYSLNVCGEATVTITVGGVEIDSIDVYPTSGVFDVITGVIDNPNNAEVIITIESDYDYLYKNVAIYKNKYPDDASVPEYSSAYKATVPEDLVAFVQGRIDFNGRSSEYRTQGRDIYLLNDSSGMWAISYYAKPQEITSSTPLTYEFEVPAQTHDAIPYKMAYLVALDIGGVSSSVLMAIKNEYAQLLSSTIEEPTARTVKITNVYGV